MFCYKSTREQLLEEQRKSAQLKAQLLKTNADLEYLSMMADIEMEQEEEVDSIE